MAVAKRKRGSTDSAIADMSSEESSAPEQDTQTDNLDIPSPQQNDESFSQPIRRHKNSLTQLGFDIRDYETAASQRPRRGASQSSTQAYKSPTTPPSRKKFKKAVSKFNSLTAQKGQGLDVYHSLLESPDLGVKATSAEREQTPEQDQTANYLPTPPRTVGKTDGQIVPQTSLRRSTRKPRPTERYKQIETAEAAPSRTKSKTISHCAEGLEEHAPATRNRKSRIVRLQLSTSVARESNSSMSFTGSFSLRHKSFDSQTSHISHSQVFEWVMSKVKR